LRQLFGTQFAASAVAESFRNRIAFRRRQAVPDECLSLILGNTEAFAVKIPQSQARLGDAVFPSAPIPFQRLGHVLGYATAFFKAKPEKILSSGMSQVGGFAKELGGLFVVLRDSFTLK